MKRHAFTLIELTIAIAILSITSAIAMTALFGLNQQAKSYAAQKDAAVLARIADLFNKMYNGNSAAEVVATSNPKLQALLPGATFKTYAAPAVTLGVVNSFDRPTWISSATGKQITIKIDSGSGLMGLGAVGDPIDYTIILGKGAAAPSYMKKRKLYLDMSGS